MKQMANGAQPVIPPTIEDAAVLDQIAPLLSP
jgi:propionyl-CoA synthetase